MAKAKSEKSLASFLPASSAPGGKVGFADKVSALQPEVNTSKGKENVYVGFRNGQGQRDGFGVMQVEDGPTYTGQWSGSKREGHGTLFFETGVFEGQWVSGKAHGRGMVHFKNGDTFQGSYADNRKMGHGVYTWSDGTVESGQYLEGQKHGAHTWSRGKERWEMVYEKGTLVATQRLDQPDAAVPGATPAEGSAQRAEEGSPSREFVAQKWMTDEARVVPRPTPPPSPPKQPKPVQPGPLKAGGSSTVLHAALSASHASQTAAPSGAAHDAPSGAARFAAPSASWRCRSDSGFRAQGFTDEEIARHAQPTGPPSSPSGRESREKAQSRVCSASRTRPAAKSLPKAGGTTLQSGAASRGPAVPAVAPTVRPQAAQAPQATPGRSAGSSSSVAAQADAAGGGAVGASEEVLRQEEEERRWKEEEARRQEEARLQEEMLQEQEEEQRRKEEETRSQEEARPQEEMLQEQEEERRRKEEADTQRT
ncbi:unnamed protein product [Durusdinium trenchii]|uniref:MORN repeat-containing protein n=1 Tax=Durusdinium trenchii TaxID=1381693 RepID=A0ABP0HXT8_9DINO